MRGREPGSGAGGEILHVLGWDTPYTRLAVNLPMTDEHPRRFVIQSNTISENKSSRLGIGKVDIKKLYHRRDSTTMIHVMP